MIDRSSLCIRAGALAITLAAAACATQEPPPAPATQAVAPPAASEQERSAREARRVKLAEEARALVAQAETDVQRARAKRALWLPAWEDLLAAREALAASDFGKASERARLASELSQLGLEQLAYPAVK
jgi:hypothetical protein